ncbi:MAG: tripartite tricarboxylate transporter substrate binding protein [Comamonadaceae bacterium]|nr:MAG: tripartite tricarboxylate transporter substrate binding protein [Comamonadaceae bacterium]
MKVTRRLAALGLAMLPMFVQAQSMGDQPVRLVVPYPAGGAVDFLARSFAQRLGEELKKTVLVENRAGAGGLIGSDYVAKAAPNGLTLLLGTNSTHAIAPYVYKKMPYDPVADFAPIALLAVSPFVVVVNPQVPARTLSELVTLAKSRPGEMTFGSSGTGTTPHLAGELFNTLTGAGLRHVPYKGSAPMVTDLVGGQIQVGFDNSAVAQIKAGKLRALALTGPTRMPHLPDVPSSAEAGMPGYEALGWFGLYAPKATPAADLNRLAQASRVVMQEAAMGEKLGGYGIQPRVIMRADFNTFLLADQAKWAKVVKDAGVQPE